MAKTGMPRSGRKRVTPERHRQNMEARKISDQTRLAAWEELVRLLIRGFTQKAAAQTLGFHEKTIEKWVHTPAFQVMLRRTRALVFTRTADAADVAARDAYAETKAKIRALADEALDKVAMLMHTSASEPLQAKCAMDLMDRAPDTQKTHKVEADTRTLVFTPENLALAFETAREIADDRRVGRHMEPVDLDERMLEPPPEREEP